MTASEVNRYLNLLQVDHRSRDLPALGRLVRAHLARIPFENISKLYYRDKDGLRSLPGVDRFLEGAERYHFGGTCYSCNSYFQQLLVSLGYQAALCGADMNEPDVHLVIMVELDGRQYLVDVGYAAPFVAPLPRDSANDHIIELGHDRYVLRPQDEQKRSRLDLYRKGERIHGYLAKPGARHIEEFNDVVADSFRADSTFINTVLLARFEADYSLVIHNQKVIESSGLSVEETQLSDKDDLAATVEARFGIPASITAQVVCDMNLTGDAWN